MLTENKISLELKATEAIIVLPIQHGGNILKVLKHGQHCSVSGEFKVFHYKPRVVCWYVMLSLHPGTACDGSPCANGGTCSLDGAGAVTCACAAGYSGSTCTGCLQTQFQNHLQK